MTTNLLEASNSGSNAPSSLFHSLPYEIQVKIYELYYPPWSLLVRDHMFSVSGEPSLFKLPFPQNAQQRQSCPSRRPCPQGKCPEADYGTIFEHEGIPTYVPSINLLLVCRFVYDHAFPVYEASYSRTLDVDLASYCLGNTKCWTLFITRFRKLLTKTRTLQLDVSKPKEFNCQEGKGKGGFNIAEYMLDLETVILNDRFKLTNSYTLLSELGVWDWTAETPTKQLEKLVERAAYKRSSLTLIWYRVGEFIGKGFEDGDLERSWRYRYEFQCRIDGVGGVYESSLPLGASKIDSVRKLDDEDVDEEYWEDEVEEADFLESDPCLVM